MEILTEFTIPGPPVGKQRVAGKGMNRYSPGKTKEFEREVGYLARAKRTSNLITPQPVGIELNIIYTPPKHWTADERDRALKGEIIPAITPDTSNVLKAVEDGMNGVIYVDDRQISDTKIRRRYGEETRIEVTVYSLAPRRKPTHD